MQFSVFETDEREREMWKLSQVSTCRFMNESSRWISNLAWKHLCLHSLFVTLKCHCIVLFPHLLRHLKAIENCANTHVRVCLSFSSYSGSCWRGSTFLLSSSKFAWVSAFESEMTVKTNTRRVQCHQRHTRSFGNSRPCQHNHEATRETTWINKWFRDEFAWTLVGARTRRREDKKKLAKFTHIEMAWWRLKPTDLIKFFLFCISQPGRYRAVNSTK